MSDLFFAFTQTGYLLSKDRKTAHAGLSDEVANFVATWNPATYRCLATSDFGGFYVAYTNQDRNPFSRLSDILDQQFPWLKEWINKDGAESPEEARIVVSGESYVAWRVNGTYTYHGIGDTLFAALHYGDLNEQRIKSVSLGPNGAFVILWQDSGHQSGGHTWDLPDNYGLLSSILKEHEDVEFLALNPYKTGDFFLVFKEHGTAIFEINQDHVRTIQGLLDSNPSTGTSSSSSASSSFGASSPFSASSSSGTHSSFGIDVAPRNPSSQPEQPKHECPICTDELGQDSDDNPLAGCEHCAEMFHGKCLGTWVKSRATGNLTTSCPHCRIGFTAEFVQELGSMTD